MNSFPTDTCGLYCDKLKNVPVLLLGLFVAYVLLALTIVKALRHRATYCPPNNQ